MELLNKIDADCDDSVMDTIRSEYGYMLQIGALFANLRPKWRFVSLLQFVCYSGFTLIHFYLFVKTLAVNHSSPNNALNTLHYGCLNLIALVILISFPLNRYVFVHLIRIIGNQYYTYTDGFRSDQVDKWKRDIRKIKLVMLVLVPSYLFLCAISLLFISPMINSLTENVKNESYVNGIYQNLPMELWYPFTIDTPAMHTIVLMSQIFEAAVVASVASCADLLVLFLSQGIAVEMKILRHSIQNLEERAMKLYMKKYGSKALSKKSRYANEEYMKLINSCIKENVQHHHVLISAFNDWFHLQKWPMACAILLGSLIIALSLLGFVMGETKFGSQLMSLLLLVAEVANMALFCSVGQQMTDLSEGMLDDLYNLNWMRWNKTCQRSLLILKEYLKTPMELKAGGLKTLNRDTFASIMNGAYSYFNLIYASKGD